MDNISYIFVLSKYLDMKIALEIFCFWMTILKWLKGKILK